MPARRTQAERSATTRGALLAGTVDALVELGFGGTTTTEVARRAGVSLGALLHHFPTKADLLCAAVGHLFEQRNVEFRAAVVAQPAQVNKAEAALDLLWSVFEGPTFLAWLELWVAARTDTELASHVVRLDEQFMSSADASLAELFPEAAAADPDLSRTLLSLVFAVMEGLSLSRLIPGYAPSAPDAVLALFKQFLLPRFPESRRTTP